MHGTETSEHMSRLLRDDEGVIWAAKPDKKAFYVSNIVGGLVVLGFMGAFFAIPFLGFATILLAEMMGVGNVVGVAVLVFAVGALLMGVLLWAATRWRYKHAEFGLTDDRAIKTSGLIGRDSSTVSLEDVRDVNVNVGLMDKIFGTGKIELQVAGGGLSGATFNYIDDPYDVLDTFEEARKRAEEAAGGA